MKREKNRTFIRKGIPLPRNKDDTQGLSLALLSLVVFVGIGAGFGSVYLAHLFPLFAGSAHPRVKPMEAFLFIPCYGMALVIVTYLSIAAWLAFAKFFFTREQVLAVCRCGVHTAFDLWLIDLFFPEKN